MYLTLERIDSFIRREEKFLPKFMPGTSQHSLLANRIAALRTVRNLLTGEGEPSQEELEFAVPRIRSIIQKMSKAREKYEPESRNYRRFDPAVKAMEEVESLLQGVLGTQTRQEGSTLL